MQGDYYYFGPTLYFCKSGSEIVNRQNTDVSLENFQDISIINNNKVNAMSARSSTEYRVPYSYYFEKLDGLINQFPQNVGGDCGYVAASI